MPSKPFTFEEFANHNSGKPNDKRQRDRDDDRPRHSVRVFCSCCDKEIDLRTVHCGRCCDDDRQRRRCDTMSVGTSHRDGSSTRRSQPVTPKTQSIRFIPESRSRSVTSMQALPSVQQGRLPTTLVDNETDLVDLSIAEENHK